MPRGTLTQDQQEARAQKKLDTLKYTKILRRLADITKDLKLSASLTLMLSRKESSTTTSTTTKPSTPKKKTPNPGSSVSDVISNKIPTISRKGEYDSNTQYFFLIDQDGYFWVVYKPLSVIGFNNLSGPYDENSAREFVNNHCKAINAASAAGIKKREVVQILIQTIVEKFDTKDDEDANLFAQEIWTHRIK